MARGAIVLVLLLVSVGDLSANEVRELSLEQKTRLSELVVIGRVESTRPETARGGSYEYARVHVDRVLKGKPPDPLDVLSKGTIAELEPDCCEVGKVYLFFLLKEKRSKGFESVNGRYGIYPIPADRPPPAANPNPAAIDFPTREPGKPWPATCLVHRTCSIVARKLAACTPGTRARPWTEIAAAPDGLAGTRVSVRGPLVLGPVSLAGVLCTEQDRETGKPMPVCCPDQSTADAKVFIGDSTTRIGVQGQRCVGDASRLCCNVDSVGRVVVATGRLEAVTGKDPLIGLAPWKLAGDVALCLDEETHAAEGRDPGSAVLRRLHEDPTLEPRR